MEKIPDQYPEHRQNGDPEPPDTTDPPKEMPRSPRSARQNRDLPPNSKDTPKDSQGGYNGHQGSKLPDDEPKDTGMFEKYY